MQVEKAIITAAARGQAKLPLQTVVDQTGKVRHAIELVMDEITSAGIDQVAIVICPGDQDRYREAVEGYADRLTFIEQLAPRGYGDALLQAREFAGGGAFLHLVSDHLYVSRGSSSCAAQLVEVAKREHCSVSAIQPTRENELSRFGAIGGSPVAQHSDLYEISCVLEKPTPTIAEQQLVVAGQRAGYYLCLFGMHVLTPHVFELLATEAETLPEDGKLHLSNALDRLARSQRYLAAELAGSRYDIGEKYGLLFAQIAIGLTGEERDTVLTQLLELVASTGPHSLRGEAK